MSVSTAALCISVVPELVLSLSHVLGGEASDGRAPDAAKAIVLEEIERVPPWHRRHALTVATY